MREWETLMRARSMRTADTTSDGTTVRGEVAGGPGDAYRCAGEITDSYLSGHAAADIEYIALA